MGKRRVTVEHSDNVEILTTLSKKLDKYLLKLTKEEIEIPVRLPMC